MPKRSCVLSHKNVKRGNRKKGVDLSLLAKNQRLSNGTDKNYFADLASNSLS